jgi:hypothetical protein
MTPLSSDQPVELPWAQPGWLEAAAAWIKAELDRRGLALSGEIEQPHIRPWSTVLRIPTAEGDLYFKAVTPLLGHEPALTEALARWQPDCILPVLAVDQPRGWLLLPDGGPTLRSQIHGVDDLWRWQAAVTRYAALQIALTDRADELLALGAFDRRLAHLPTLYDQLLTDTAALLIDQPDGLTTAEYDRLQSLSPLVAQMAGELSTFGLPETIHHDDFHDANIFTRDDHHYLFFDWGESCVTHPLFSILLPPRGIAYRLKLAADAPELIELRRVYLAAWREFLPEAKLSAAYALAHPLAMINRTLTWYHVVSNLAEPFKSQEADAVPGWLQEFLGTVKD